MYANGNVPNLYKSRDDPSEVKFKNLLRKLHGLETSWITEFVKFERKNRLPLFGNKYIPLRASKFGFQNTTEYNSPQYCDAYAGNAHDTKPFH